jgi:hypothetical protein
MYINGAVTAGIVTRFPVNVIVSVPAAQTIFIIPSVAVQVVKSQFVIDIVLLFAFSSNNTRFAVPVNVHPSNVWLASDVFANWIK